MAHYNLINIPNTYELMVNMAFGDYMNQLWTN